MLYPGKESENINYYNQFNPEYKENRETLDKKLICGGGLELKYGSHTYKYSFQKVENVNRLPSNPKGISILRLYFYNEKLHQGKVCDVLYKKQGNKLQLVGYIHQGYIEKYDKPIDIALDMKHNIAEFFIKALKCNNCKYSINGNTILIFEETIREKVKKYHKGIFSFELKWGKKVNIKPVLNIKLGEYNGLIKNTKGKILGRIEKYPNTYLVLDTKGKVLGQINNSKIVSLPVDNGTVKLKIKLEQ